MISFLLVSPSASPTYPHLSLLIENNNLLSSQFGMLAKKMQLWYARSITYNHNGARKSEKI
jgi:hypothetical protein